MEQVAGLIYAVAAGAETEYITTLRPDVIAAAIRGPSRHGARRRAAGPGAAVRRHPPRGRPDRQRRHASGGRCASRRTCPLELRRRLFRTVHAALGGELRLVLSSAAHLSPALQRSWEALGVEVVQGYGSTEAGLVVDQLPGTHARSTGSAGRCRRWSCASSPTARSSSAGPSVFSGYWRTRSRPPRPSRPTAGTAPATSARSTRRAPCAWSGGRAR